MTYFLIVVAFLAGNALGIWLGKAIGERDEARRHLAELKQRRP